MRVLLVSQYYAPEVGATQNRMLAFVDALRARGHSVTVICEQPNHPHGVFQPGYGRRPLVRQRAGGVRVNRVWVYASPRKSTVRRLLFYGTFAAGAAAAVGLLPRHDVVFVTSPPLPGALAVAAAARLRRTPVVLDVRDLWPAAAEALGELSNPRALRAFAQAERWLYRTAVAVTATTNPFCRHIDSIAGTRKATHLPNGALDELVDLPRLPPPAAERFRIGYFGNFGIAQGLGIVPEAAGLLGGEAFEFLLVGGGPLEEELKRRVKDLGLTNVTIQSSVPPAQVGDLMLSCHALLVPLRDHPLLSDFIPSKVYDGMAVGRPVILAARGEAAAFIAAHKCGLVIEPEDGAALAAAARELQREPGLAKRLGTAGKDAAAGFSRSGQGQRLWELLEEIVRAARWQ